MVNAVHAGDGLVDLKDYFACLTERRPRHADGAAEAEIAVLVHGTNGNHGDVYFKMLTVIPADIAVAHGGEENSALLPELALVRGAVP